MAGGNYNIEIEPGTTLFLPILYTASSTPVNFTGYDVIATFQRAKYQDPSLVLSSLNGGILATPSLGLLTIYGTPWQTSELSSSNTGVWKLQFFSQAATPFKYTLLSGKVTFDY